MEPWQLIPAGFTESATQVTFPVTASPGLHEVRRKATSEWAVSAVSSVRIAAAAQFLAESPYVKNTLLPLPAGPYEGPLTVTSSMAVNGVITIQNRNFRSPASGTAAVLIQTTVPVVLQNCLVAGPDTLIDTAFQDNVDLTLRHVRGFGTLPTVDNSQQGRFLFMYLGKRLVMEHCYLQGTQGCTLNEWRGTDVNSSICVRYNKCLHLLGKPRNTTADQNACFLQLSHVQNVPGVDIGWNQLVNLSGVSTPGDNININDSRGTSDSWLRIHHNYVYFSGPLNPATNNNFSGSGMTTDGSNHTAATCTRYVLFEGNTIVATGNGGLNINAGRDVRATGNTIVTCGALEDGTTSKNRYAGTNISNGYGNPAPLEAFDNIEVDHNTYGYVNGGSNAPYNIDADSYHTAPVGAVLNVHDNTFLPMPITLATEYGVWRDWQQAATNAGLTIGPFTS